MLKIYAINLDKRSDRWADLQASSLAQGLNPAAIQRLPAVADPEFGALGCAKSHVAALSNFLTHDTAPYCLVLEDDFELVRPWGEFVAAFNALAEERVDWDALLLMGTAVLAPPPRAPGVARLLEAQSAAAYLVSRRYAPAVLACFADCIPQMEALRGLQPRAAVTARFAIDQAWKTLQRRDRWYIFSPAFGRQRPSFSDIEQRDVNYDAMTYGLQAA